ncbi:MAG TPA: excinuclease ABC subunit UvrC [Armatimonadota bacterium]
MNTDLEKKLKHLPDKPGSYLMKDERGQVIYVGKAASLRSRVRSYFQKGQAHGAKVLVMVSKIHDVDWIVTDSEVEALMLECNLIKKHRPHYNIRLRDDKHYPYVCVTTSEPFPRVLVVRRAKQDGNRYFGPFVDSSALRESLKVIRRVFRVRNCNKALVGTESDKPCLNYHMGQCDAPCAGRVTQDQYTELANDTLLFLEGRQDSLIRHLQDEMTDASDTLEFERAARLRDQIDSLRKLMERQKMINTDLTDRDIVAISMDGAVSCVQLMSVRSGRLVGEEHFYLEGVSDETPDESLGEFVKQYYRDAVFVPREILLSHEPLERHILEDWLSGKRGGRVKLVHPQKGEKFRLVMMASENARLSARRQDAERLESSVNCELDLSELREAIGLLDDPIRIEGYDISNIQGTEAVGSMVVFIQGASSKSEYRRFKIKTIAQPDDYGMMREVIRRRFANAVSGDSRFKDLPDLVLIDGGRGQLNAAQEAMHESGLNVRMISLAKRLEEVYLPEKEKPILLPRDSRALRLLQRVRDESHRFALSYHHKLKEKSANISILDSIPGIGNQRRKLLIKKFGSVAGVRRCSLEELMLIPGISKQVAEAVYDALHTVDE